MEYPQEKLDEVNFKIRNKIHNIDTVLSVLDHVPGKNDRQVARYMALCEFKEFLLDLYNTIN